MEYAAYKEWDYVCNIAAESAEEALAKAQALNPEVSRVELVLEPQGPQAA